jgi:2,4-dienoyl-CoA reductase-like NADH-dependent reductase (Old Yellow Enzyme family)
MTADLRRLLSPIQLAGLRLRNGLIKTATFEGMCPAGRPGDDLVAHHARMAKGGVGMTTVAYCGVSADGLTFADQMWMHEGILPQLQCLTDAVHAEGAAVSAQLSHCGGFSRARPVTQDRPLGPSGGLNAYGLFSGVPFRGSMSVADIERTVADYARAAALVRRAGFDAVEIHMGHGYLLSQFISAATNKRRDCYGGSLSNRMRFPLKVLAAVREAVGPGVPILAKFNLSDGFAGGLDIQEACAAAQMLEAAGLDALVMSGGSVSRTPMFLFRGDSPLPAMIELERNPLQRLAMKLFGGASFANMPYRELYFLELARQVRHAVRMPLVYLGGVSSAAALAQLASEGFEFAALGRALLHDPDFPLRLARAEQPRSGCTHCNLCVASVGLPGGIRCLLNPTP